MARTKQTYVPIPAEKMQSSHEPGAAWGKLLSEGDMVEIEAQYARTKAEVKKDQKLPTEHSRYQTRPKQEL
jgi:hypothetical protein